MTETRKTPPRGFPELVGFTCLLMLTVWRLVEPDRHWGWKVGDTAAFIAMTHVFLISFRRRRAQFAETNADDRSASS